MELEDLTLKHYRVEKVLGGIYPARFRMVAIQDPNGNYKADSAEKIERVFATNCTIRQTDNIFFRTQGRGASRKWRPMIRK